MSAGLRMVNVAEYSTIPRALRGASSMSVMMAFCGSLGSSSPLKRPVSFSYGCLALASGWVFSTVSLTTSPVAADAAASTATAHVNVRRGLAMRQMLLEPGRLRASGLGLQAWSERVEERHQRL